MDGNSTADRSLSEDMIMFKEKGTSCFCDQKYAEAITFYDKAIEKCPESNKHYLAILYQCRAITFGKLEIWSQVKDDCSKTLEYIPTYSKAYFRRAKAHEATKDILECLDDLTAMLSLEKLKNRAIENTILTYFNCIAEQTGYDAAAKDTLTRKHILPSKHFIKSYFQSFIFDPVSKDIPKVDNPKGYIRAKMAFDEENYDDVICACSEELNSCESNSQYTAESLLLRGTFHILSGNFKLGTLDLNAVINHEKVASGASLRANAFIKRGAVRIQLGNKLGFSDFDEAKRIFPNNPDLHIVRGEVYFMLDHISGALEEFEKAVKLAPNHVIAYVRKCSAEYCQAKSDEDHMRISILINKIENSIETFPDFFEYYELMGRILTDEEQFDKANLFYKTAIQISPKTADLYTYHGLSLQVKGDLAASIELLNKAIEIDDKCKLAYASLGEIEFQRGCMERAIQLLEQAILLATIPMEILELYTLRNIALAKSRANQKLGI